MGVGVGVDMSGCGRGCGSHSCRFSLCHTAASCCLAFVARYPDWFYLCRALTVFKGKLKGAVKGHSLLKRKSDALKIKFRKILKELLEV